MILKKEFYFIRHGQTDYNISNSKVDHEDVSLNIVGFQQAESIASVFRNLPIRSICFSPLKRAKETKEVICKNIQANHYEIPELGECSLQVWNDMTACGVNACHSSHEHVKIFMQKVLNGINQALSYEGPVLIVAHGGIHWATCCFMGLNNYDWTIANCVPMHFSLTTENSWNVRRLS